MGCDMTTGRGRYFRITASGMCDLRDWMASREMVCTDYEDADMPEYVAPEAVSCADEARRDSVQRDCELSTAWRPTRWNHLLRRYVPLPGIAEHELCSHDWWLITAAECREALDAWARSEQADRDAWPGWIDFLTAAVDECGIVVR